MRLGTRGSALALAQAGWVAQRLGDDVEVVEIVTTGDGDRAARDKEKWVRELDRALLDGEIDLAVHSAKDVPGALAGGVTIAGAPARADARDALCGAVSLDALAPGATVGTSSVRRTAQLHALREDLLVRELRGNVDTRLRRLADGDYDAIVVARAGLERLGRGDAVDGTLSELVPAAGQGILAVTARTGDDAARAAAAAISDEHATVALAAERALVIALEADCDTPVGAHCAVTPDRLTLTAFVGRTDGAAWLRDALSVSRTGAGDAEALGAEVARRLLSAGAAEVLGAMTDARVHLVGAGPGDPGLMTARSLELIARADVILFDKLIPDAALAGARPEAELIDVGKIGGGKQVPQDVTTALLVEHAQAGREVVRLKGGDPFVFGRGGEEAQALAAAGVPFTVVPGVTAGVAAPAYAGIPVTQRNVASAVAFVTGHENPDKPETAIDWPALAGFPGTLVFYMGVRQLPRIAEQLIAAGRRADEPVAVIERGTFGDQRSLVATLATVAERAAAAQIRPPSITVIGDVAALGEELAWLPDRPLIGRTIAVTRARAQASALAARLRALGARVVETPAIRIEPLPAVVPDLAGYDLLCVTSPNGAARLLEEVRDARALAGPTIAAIGPGTARALADGGIVADVVPERAVAESLLDALDRRADGGQTFSRAMIARAEEARDLLPDGLRARGVEVDLLALYRTMAEPLDEEARAAVLGAEYLTFASASAVRFTHAAVGTLAGPKIVSIGPVTSGALRELGFPPDVEATEHTPDGLAAALVADARRTAGGPSSTAHT